MAKLRDGVEVDAQGVRHIINAVNDLVGDNRAMLVIDAELAKAIEPDAREVLQRHRAFAKSPLGIAFVVRTPFWRVVAGLLARLMDVNGPCEVFPSTEEAAQWLLSLQNAEHILPLSSIVASTNPRLGLTELRADGIVMARVTSDFEITLEIAKEGVDAVVELLKHRGTAPVIAVLRWPNYSAEGLRYLVERASGPLPEECIALVAGTSYAKLLSTTSLRFLKPVVPIQVFSDIPTAVAWCHDQMNASRVPKVPLAGKTVETL